LGVLCDLFRRLDQAGIRYCHWKSNEHLGAAMSGATDVDVLVERSAAQRLTRLLTETDDFKRFVVKAGRGYPGIEDYVGFDRATGTLTHLHVHYQLTLGEKFLKGHRLPWESVVLDTRVLDPEHGGYVTDPHLELLILVARAAIKLRWRDYALALLGRRYFGGSMLRELRWLAQRVRTDRLAEVAAPLVGAEAAGLLGALISWPAPSLRLLRAFRRDARPRLSAYRMYSAAGTVRRMWTREWTWILWRVTHIVLRAPTRSTRTLPQGGVSVAFVGADEAGTTTLASQCADWLAGEVAVTLQRGGHGMWARRLRRTRSLGMVALSDQLPANSLPGDSSAGLIPLDLVIRVKGPEGGASRAFPPGTRLAEIDGTGSRDQILLQAKLAIWGCL
jgi:hypothetical protein